MRGLKKVIDGARLILKLRHLLTKNTIKNKHEINQNSSEAANERRDDLRI